VPPAMPLRVPGSINAPFGPLRPVDGQDAMAPAGPLSEGDTAMHQVVPSNQKQAREIIRLKDQLVKARKMSAAGTFCLSLVPDLLDRVTNICEQLADPGDAVDPAALRQRLEPVREGLERIMKATQVIPAPRSEPSDVGAVVSRAVEMVQPDTDIHRIKLTVDVAEGLQALTDPQRLVVALTEFIKSAIRSGRSGATVAITGVVQEDGVLLTISNQSQEISANGLMRVFDPFVTSDVHWQRLGLGIFEARQIIMSFGGTVTLESTEGLGTTVDIVLPAV
jgi:signal transduction histidine kinase